MNKSKASASAAGSINNAPVGLNAVVGAATGGTAEALGGGKFANGAVTGAFVGMFNHAQHGGDDPPGNSASSGEGYPYVTDKFNSQIATTEAFFSVAVDVFNCLSVDIGTREALKLMFFREMVKTGSPFDIKRTSFSREALGNVAGLYNGEVFSSDDFGNYNFGVAARAFGYSARFAKYGAGVNQVLFQPGQDWSNWSGLFDFRRDTEMIGRGFNHK